MIQGHLEVRPGCCECGGENAGKFIEILSSPGALEEAGVSPTDKRNEYAASGKVGWSEGTSQRPFPHIHSETSSH